MSDFIKLVDLVDGTFTVEKVWGYKFKLWDSENKKMLSSDTWVKGYRKVYNLQTNMGGLDVSAGQFANMLESVSKNGVADVNGRTFAVKSNGKTGMDIRYYINPTKDPVQTDKVEEVVDDEPINLDDIGF